MQASHHMSLNDNKMQTTASLLSRTWLVSADSPLEVLDHPSSQLEAIN